MQKLLNKLTINQLIDSLSSITNKLIVCKVNKKPLPSGTTSHLMLTLVGGLRTLESWIEPGITSTQEDGKNPTLEEKDCTSIVTDVIKTYHITKKIHSYLTN